MAGAPDILCIGSVHWDIIGRTTRHVRLGADVPGRITRGPGGVALNIAMTLRRFGMRPALLTAVGSDAEGRELLELASRMEIMTDHVHVADDLPTDRYMAIEDGRGLVAAIADAHTLEAAGDAILRPLSDGRLGSVAGPYAGPVALDGNLLEGLLAEIAASPLLARTDLRVAAASPEKAKRLLPFLGHPSATLYLNLEEASVLAGARFTDSAGAAEALLCRGAARVFVTDGARGASEGYAGRVRSLAPPPVPVARVTGAGDTLMAAHIAAEARGDGREDTFAVALAAAADYVSGDTPP